MARNVLIVEDDEELQELYAAMLVDLDCQITRAYDGGQGLDRLEESNPDVIIVDMLLDEVHGDEFFLAVKAKPAYADVPVVIASVLSPERCQHLLEMDPRTIYLRKPFRKAQLEDVVQRCLAGGGKRVARRA